MPARKYSFVASLQDLKIGGPLGSGWTIAADLKLSTSETIVKKLMNPPFIGSIGHIEAAEIQSGKPFLFALADYPLEDTSPEAQIGLLNARLQTALSLCTALWLIKDNSINFDRAFLQFPHETPVVSPRVSINSWTTRFSKADGSIGLAEFSKEELKAGIAAYNNLYESKSSSDVSPGLTPGTAGTVDRLPRALYFLQGARAMGDLAHKVANYCTSLEALVSTSSTELAHQVSERVAILIAKDSNDALEIYRNLKRAYTTRSKLVHGDSLTADNDQFLKESLNCDGYLRRLILLLLTQGGVAHALEQSREKVNEFFLSRLFADEQSLLSDP
jgi:hypothetical protein